MKKYFNKRDIISLIFIILYCNIVYYFEDFIPKDFLFPLGTLGLFIPLVISFPYCGSEVNEEKL